MQIVFIIIGLLALSYLILVFLTSPSGRKNADLKILKGSYIAHRGLHDSEKKIPENSLQSFQKAVEKNLPIEIDLHLTKDEKVVVFHDGNTKRMCGNPGKIEEMTLEEIKALRLLDTEEQIPTLEECLDLVDGKVFLLIEFKMVDGNTKKLCEKADEILSAYHGKYFIQSFYPQVVCWYRKNRKEICRGQLAGAFRKKGFAKWLLGNMLLNFLGRPDFISYRYRDAASPMLKFAIWQGAVPVGWTFESEKELRGYREHFQAWIFERFIVQ